MFTGLILELGEITSLARQGEGARLTIRAKEVLGDARKGDSVAVNGICLTVTSFQRDNLSFDVSFETLRSTNLGELKPGDRVNLEPSLRPDSRLGGHFVTGHVEATGRILSREAVGEAVKVRIAAPGSVTAYLVGKGSVAVDGISLTVTELFDGGFSVVIIPHTFSMTTIGFKKPGETVNLEPDILAKYVAKLVRGHLTPTAEDQSARTGSSTPDEGLLSALRKSGFLS